MYDRYWYGSLPVDEGHVAYSKVSNAMRMAIQLSVERRWIVSGSR